MKFNDKQKKILLFTNGGVGGAERVSILFAKTLMQEGWNCKIFVYAGNISKIDILDFIPDTIQTEVIRGRFRKLFFILFGVIRRERPDVVFASMPYLIALLAIIRRFVLRSFILIGRQYATPSRLTGGKLKSSKRFLPMCDKIIAQTNEMRDEIINLFYVKPEKVVTIYNPIDKELIDEKLREQFVVDKSYINFVAVGRIAEAKDYEVMLRAFSIFHHTHEKSKLFIVGAILGGEYCQSILKLSKDLGLSEAVSFEGFQNNPYKYIAASDVYLLSSKTEGLPNVMIEAFYIGKPIVATRCIPFIEQTIKDGETGYSVPVGDYNAMAQAMEKAIHLEIASGVDVTSGTSAINELFKNLK